MPYRSMALGAARACMGALRSPACGGCAGQDHAPMAPPAHRRRFRARPLQRVLGATSGQEGPIEIDPDEPRFQKGRKLARRAGGLKGAVADASSALQKSLLEVWAGRQYGDGVGLVWRDDIKDRITLSAVLWDLIAEILSSGSGVATAVLGCPSARPSQLQAVAQVVNADLPPWLREQLPVEAAVPDGAPSPAIVLRRRGPGADPPPPLEEAPLPPPAEAEANTRAWVSRVMVGLNVCPFTASDETAGTGLEDLGVRPAPIHYATSGERTVAPLVRDFWVEIVGLLRAPERQRSTGLLCLPAFDGDWPRFRAFTALLEASARASNLFLDAGLVWFHPDYVTGDELEYGHMHPAASLRGYLGEFYPEEFGEGGTGVGGAGWEVLERANEYARRSPHATVNTLRVHQVALAERKRPGLSKQVYAANARRLAGVGEERLARELRDERGGCPLGLGGGAESGGSGGSDS